MVELMAVIAIVVVLMATLFPVFASARRTAYSTSCLSNLRQLGTSVSIYQNDYDDYYPQMVDAIDRAKPSIWSSHPDWQSRIPNMEDMPAALRDYGARAQVFRCPRDLGATFLYEHLFNFPNGIYNAFGSSYAYNTTLAFKELTESSLEDVAFSIVLHDMAGCWHGLGSAITKGDSSDSARDKIEDYRYNTFFADGHARSLTSDQLQGDYAGGP
ncbi:MAG: prepilin-type cleavage/methylation domain-containing protein [Armatimonadetes bacterium]|nr:prepilin-type cleavage/methylation domain-containing protein [Armatimonadota bacterium]